MVISLTLLPLSSFFSTRLQLPEGHVYLFYLPMAMMVAMLMVFDWLALPGITLALALRYFNLFTPGHALTTCLIFIINLSCCWLGYHLQAGRRWGVTVGAWRVLSARLFWLSFLLTTLSVMLLQLMVTLGVIPESAAVVSRDPFTLRTLINYQSFLLSCMAMTPLYYCVIRILRDPRFARQLFQRMKRQVSEEVSAPEIACWLGLLCLLLMVFGWLSTVLDHVRVGDYAMMLLLPTMLWSATRFGYLLTSLSWSLVLITLFQFREQFLVNPAMYNHLAVIFSNLLIFTLTLIILSTSGTRQRRIISQTRRAALIDPIIDLPNLRALSGELSRHPHSTLCFLRIPELDLLSRTYGLQLRIQYKRGLAAHLRPQLQPHEGVYQLPGFDLALRLEKSAYALRVEEIAAALNDYRLLWDGLPLQPEVGVSYCHIKPPVSQLHELLGEMSALAEVSLHSRRAEQLQEGSVSTLQTTQEKVNTLQAVQRALQEGGFVLMAQRIEGTRGDDFHEVLLNMVDSNGELIEHARFLTVVHECGMTWEIDRWLLAQTLDFIATHRETLPAARLAVKLFATSFCRPHLANEIGAMLAERGVEPWQLIIEVAESPVLSDVYWGNQTMIRLRQIGCRVIIDGFGAGYASYLRLNNVQADMLKIDGGLARNILNSSLDYQIVESICRLARLKKMQVVAMEVQEQPVAAALKNMGVDYLQGTAIGQAMPLSGLSQASGASH
ncbi:Membrane protein [Paramixta manurensis]|uniref:Membrane protein n=1 Tax=Paramixta manurensis TaxID=2740817 RepID=A0A6M8UBL2_9GAMM|nr:Membrane protein [Erwiniaceae bacterium PD-1]